MFNKVTLELSLKPFKQLNEEYIRSICAEIYQQWYALLKNRKEISFLLWTADGSEILDYAGCMETAFEWCYFIGQASLPLADEGDRIDRSLGERKRLYMENPPAVKYRDLRRIIQILKEEGKRRFPDAIITVGETFDIGPEFAVSDFKYNRHPEICTGQILNGRGMVDATSLLHGDSRSYAAYPNGIPEGTPFALFFGKQANVFLADMGFDYLWLSNGLGFSDNPWNMDGKVYDGQQFHPERLAETRKSVFDFWKMFRKGCPDYPIQTRGTNNSVGIDYATDGVPLYDIYKGHFQIQPPPNSPWAALNDNFGLELMGHMTRICELPGDQFLFRFYVHDPWWNNSPWYDRYGSQPHDIYLPMAVSRIDGQGNVQSAGMLNILSIDNSFGNMPDCCANEPIPHLLKAEKHSPDEPAPFVWVYPMREYTTTDDPLWLEEMYFGDRFVCDSINAGFPLNCVVSSDNFLKNGPETFRKSILISPVPIHDNLSDKLKQMRSHGIPVICYGSGAKKHLVPDGCLFADTGDKNSLLSAVAALDYKIEHICSKGTKVPTMTIAKHENGFWFSVYNTNTTTRTKLKFPLGAPILLGGETCLTDGYSTYHFSRSEYRECRIFVKQESGLIGAREVTPGPHSIRRRFKVTGLEDATVFYFPETDCAEFSMVADGARPLYVTPDVDFSWTLVKDPVYGTYWRSDHVTGDRVFEMPHTKYREEFKKFLKEKKN